MRAARTGITRVVFEELRRLGHIEGQNLTVEGYGREQNVAGPEALAADIVRSNPDVVFVVGPGAPIFKQATRTIPIVTVTGDPVAQGLARSLAHPGGNITGASVDAGPAIHGKRIALLREMFPGDVEAGLPHAAHPMEWPGPGTGDPRRRRGGGHPAGGVACRFWRRRGGLSGGHRQRLARGGECDHDRGSLPTSWRTGR